MNFIELRASNAVEFNGEQTVLDLKELALISMNYEKVKNVLGIKISPSQLKKIGFIKKTHKWCDGIISYSDYWYEDYFIGINDGYITFSKKTDNNSCHYITNVEYIHQIQNLYLDLEKVVLTYNN